MKSMKVKNQPDYKLSSRAKLTATITTSLTIFLGTN